MPSAMFRLWSIKLLSSALSKRSVSSRVGQAARRAGVALTGIHAKQIHTFTSAVALVRGRPGRERLDLPEPHIIDFTESL